MEELLGVSRATPKGLLRVNATLGFGAPPDARVIARHIAPNQRLLCAAPAFRAQHGMPKVLGDLARHNCIGIRQGEEAYGVWRLSSGRGRHASTAAIKTRGDLTTNDGEIAVNWALDEQGILMRAEWDIDRDLKNGRLVPPYDAPDADIHAGAGLRRLPRGYTVLLSVDSAISL